jgi:hypothetical protein
MWTMIAQADDSLETAFSEVEMPKIYLSTQTQQRYFSQLYNA